MSLKKRYTFFWIYASLYLPCCVLLNWYKAGWFMAITGIFGIIFVSYVLRLFYADMNAFEKKCKCE
jgi:hypothetical protein